MSHGRATECERSDQPPYLASLTARAEDRPGSPHTISWHERHSGTQPGEQSGSPIKRYTARRRPIS